MRVALTADLQLQTQPRYSTIASTGLTTRLVDMIECFNWIVDEAVKAKCERLFVMGDVFDSRTVIDVCVIDQACRAFSAASKRIAIDVIVGNHDAYLRTPRLNSTQMLASCTTVHEGVASTGQFVVVPWIDDQEAYRSSLQRAGSIRKRMRSRAFLLSHGMFGEAVPMAKGMPIEWLLEGKWDGVYLGDVHDPVVLQADPMIRYVGSPMQLHFGDAGRKRGFVVLDTETGKSRFVENPRSPRFHLLKSVDDVPKPTSARDFFRVRAEDDELADVLVDAARKLSDWVEVETAASGSAEGVRIAAAGTLSDEDLLRAYCKHVLVDPDLMVPLGLSLLHEARE